MKRIFLILFLFPFLSSCNDAEKRTGETKGPQIERHIPGDSTTGEVQEDLAEESATEKDGVARDTTEEEVQSETPQTGMEGEYRRVDSEGNTGPCECSCIEISFSHPTELCISDKNIYITARFEKTGANSADIYFENEVQSDALADDIPWDDFDRNIPVASVTRQPDNSLKLDWKGFTIGGELAVDYAIYGKKTLEGNFKKE